jgi:hypothetical protein
VPRARGADNDPAPSLEDEVLVGRGRVEARLRLHGLGVDLGEALAHPGGDALDDRGIGRRLGVGIRLGAGVVRSRFEPVHRVVQ